MRLENKVDGGEGEIRTPDSLATMSDFESGAFNRAPPPLRPCLVYRHSGRGAIAGWFGSWPVWLFSFLALQ